MKLFIPVLTLLLLTFSNQVSSQEFPSKLSKAQLKSFGENAERTGDLLSAIHYYKKYTEKAPEDSEIIFRLANCYQKTHNYQAAEAEYDKLSQNHNEDYPQALFLTAKMQRRSGKYREAFLNLQTFAEHNNSPETWKAYKKEYKIELASCNYSILMKDSLSNIEVLPLDTSINKFQADFSPFLVDENTLIFSSLRTNSVSSYTLEDNTVKPSKKIYKAIKSGGSWQYAGEFEGPFNKNGVNTANGIITPDGERFIFSRCTQNWKYETICELYMSKKEGNIWQLPIKLTNGINGVDFSSTQPTIGIDSEKNREILYFSSNRKGGKGGWDLWLSVYNEKKGEYKKPRNLGSSINTPRDEITPFYDITNRTLFFSSNGLIGFGAQDIYISQGELRDWTTPKNAGKPLNSSVDDIYYSYANDPANGFFVSNRKNKFKHSKSSCCFDIFSFKNIEYKYIKMSGVVHQIIVENNKISTNAPDKNLIKNAIVSLYKKDLTKGEYIFIKQDTTSTDGSYNFNLQADSDYKITAKVDSFSQNSFTLSTDKVLKSGTFVSDFGLVKKEKKQKSVRILKIHYSTGEYKLTKEAKQVIDTTLFIILQKYPSIVIEISSYSDNIGKAETNLLLSQKRADGVAKYLISKGINKSRVQSKGYGEKFPIAKNQFAGGLDNPEGRRKNRRTEFKTIGTISKDIKIVYE